MISDPCDYMNYKGGDQGCVWLLATGLGPWLYAHCVSDMNGIFEMIS